jgi:hypothetical protein
LVDLPQLRLDEHGRQRALLQVRGLAALRRATPVLVALVAAGTIALATCAVVLAADPTTGPGSGAGAAPTCAERYPAEGPAGLDLRLGCLIGELVGHYTGSAATANTAATPASTYGLIVLAILVAGALAIWLAGRLVGRIAGRRLAPVRADTWWLCATCRSVNDSRAGHCYSCAAPRPEAVGPLLRTDDAPSTTQSFGSTRKRG